MTNTNGGIFEVDPQHLVNLAQGHDDHAASVAAWSGTEPDLAERILATHGKVAYQTALNARAFTQSRNEKGLAYAARNRETADKLRINSENIVATDEASANALRQLAPGDNGAL